MAKLCNRKRNRTIPKNTKLGWRKFRRRISEFCYVGGIFTGHNTARSASLNSASVGRMKMLQRQKIGRDLARIANLAQLIPASCTDCITDLLFCIYMHSGTLKYYAFWEFMNY